MTERQDEKKDSKVIGSWNTPYIERHDIDDDDPRYQEFQREWDDLTGTFKEDVKRFKENSVTFSTRGEFKMWEAAQATHDDLWDLILPVLGGSKQSNSPEETVTLGDRIENDLFLVGAAVLFVNVAKRRAEIASRNGFLHKIQPVIDRENFILAKSVLIRINGFSIADLYDTDLISKKRLSDLYSFFVDTHTKPSEEWIKEPTVDTQLLGAIGTQYPLITKGAVPVTVDQIDSIGNSKPEYLDSYVRRSSGSRKAAAEVVQKILENTARITGAVFATMLNPNSPDFPDLKEKLSAYLNQGEYTKILALYVAGLRNSMPTIELYRRAINFQRQGVEPDFYKQISDSILDLVGETRGVSYIPTKEDVVSLIKEPDTQADQSKTDYSELRTLISNIFSRSSGKFYRISTEEVSWSSVVAPSAVAIEFNSNNPRKFVVSMVYQNEFGESIFLNLGYDLTKDFSDWSFLQSPSDPEMEPMANAALQATKDILESLYKKVDEQYHQKQQARIIQLQPKPLVSQESNIVKFVPPRPQADKTDLTPDKAKKVAPLTPIQQTLQEAIKREESRVKNQIPMPTSEVMEKLLENIASYDREAIINGITRFNQNGLGLFKMLKGEEDDGEPLYVLRVGTRVPKGARILMKESGSILGMRSFEIADIRYRKDIYKKHGI